MQSPGSMSGSDDEAQSYDGRGRRSLCRSKNAILARENRIRKKMYVKTLEKQISSLKSENKRVQAVADTQVGYIADLRAEIKYLRSVLANSKEIGFLVRKIKTPIAPKNRNPIGAPLFDGSKSPLLGIGTQDLFDSPFEDDLFPMTEPFNTPEPEELKERTSSETFSDHNYSAHFKSNGTDDLLKDVGVCLHVSKTNMSLEFCSACNDNAIKNWDFDDY